jgi:hypothetical protein
LDLFSRIAKGVGVAGAIGGFIPVLIFGTIGAAILQSLWPLGITLGAYTVLVASLLRTPAPPKPLPPPAPVPPRRVTFQEGGVWTPSRHFDLMLSAKHDIGRIRGAAHAISDARTARAFSEFARRAEVIVQRLVGEPMRLGFARELLSSHLPRAADMAEGAHAIRGNTPDDITRRARMTDLIERLATAIEQSEQDMVAPELLRLDADLELLTQDLKEAQPPQLPPPAQQPMPLPFSVRQKQPEPRR